MRLTANLVALELEFGLSLFQWFFFAWRSRSALISFEHACTGSNEKDLYNCYCCQVLAAGLALVLEVLIIGITQFTVSQPSYLITPCYI